MTEYTTNQLVPTEVKAKAAQPEPKSYVNLLKKVFIQFPQGKIDARPALGPLLDQARELLAQDNPDSDACLALYQQIMKVPPASQGS